jgi:hypothetical protein
LLRGSSSETEEVIIDRDCSLEGRNREGLTGGESAALQVPLGRRSAVRLDAAPVDRCPIELE